MTVDGSTELAEVRRPTTGNARTWDSRGHRWSV